MRRAEFYRRCGDFLERVVGKRASLRSACFGTKNPQPYFALLSNVIKNYAYLEGVLAASGVCAANKYVSLVETYEILRGKQVQNTELAGALRGKATECRLVKDQKQRVFVRVNSLRFTGDLCMQMTPTAVPSVFELPGSVDYRCPFYARGDYFVQNLASCLPAFILDPPPNSVVIDTCAAPGNKTTHLAAIMANTGKIYAVEKDANRCRVLRSMVAKSGATNVEVVNKDFLDITHAEFGDAEYALVDPSCSGSGIHSLYTRDDVRLRKLQSFQIRIATHLAQSRNIKEFVYSTCSVHVEENEEVVRTILATCPDFVLGTIKDFWPIRGDTQYEFAQDVIRCYPNTDAGTIGFFAAWFVRKKTSPMGGQN